MLERLALEELDDEEIFEFSPKIQNSTARTEERLQVLAKNFKKMTSPSSTIVPGPGRPFGTARLTPGRNSDRKLDAPEPMIAIALSDMEYLMRSARSSKSSGRSERQSGCTCCCHIAAGVTVIPRCARFTVEGGLSTHTLMNHSDNRIALKITCSDNNMYRVTPVYATVEAGQSLPLHIARIKSDLIKRDRLCVNILEGEGSKEAREIFKKSNNRSATINVALDVTMENQK
ncbi:unnamed protein product [Caenorhabditis angaria]|uniref:Major sperm protein n=1 Tax=Caenorhabditis angaria TaxID=860376 RepID=A0A9P1N1K1_9PELO|nr:unnamed protein product [Caenorhabditis angaria]